MLHLTRRRVSQLGQMICKDKDLHVDVAWHPRLRNQKVLRLSEV